jgi:glutathione synthase/RimK-type ligase-like ATP-grasp enzyme
VSAADVILVTGAEMPRADDESPLLVTALGELGLRAETRVWREPYRWEEAGLVVCRSPWDYFRHAEEFLTWTDHVAAVTRFENPAALVRWNAHKSYLSALAAAGVPVVPTVFVPRGADADERSAALAPGGEFVVKPAVGAGALGARRGDGQDPDLAAHLGDLVARGDVLVQPFLDSVTEGGEASLIFFDGRLSHAVRKLPATGDFRVQEQHGGTVVGHEPSPAELGVARSALDAAPGTTAYARMDVVSGPDGPLLMEAELIEPYLFLSSHRPAVARLAEVLAARMN